MPRNTPEPVEASPVPAISAVDAAVALGLPFLVALSWGLPERRWHGLARAVRRGLDNMRIQSYLTAAAINLKRLAAAILVLMFRLFDTSGRSRRDKSPSEPKIAKYAGATRCTF